MSNIIDLSGHGLTVTDGQLRMDAATRQRTNAHRLDAGSQGQGALLAQQLEHVYSEVLREEFPPQSSALYFPIDQSVAPGARSHTVNRIETRGQAKVHRGNSPVPLVSATQESETFPVHHYVIGIELDIFELQASNFAGTQIRQELQTAAQFIMQEFLNEKTWFGDIENNITGVLNYPWLPKMALAQKFSTATSADDMLSALNAAANTAHAETSAIYGPDSMLVSPRMLRVLQTKRFPGADAARLADEFKAANPLIKNIDSAWELQGTGPGGTDYIFFYRRDLRSVANVIPQTFTMLPLQTQNFSTLVPCYMSHGGIVQRDVLNNLLAYAEVG